MFAQVVDMALLGARSRTCWLEPMTECQFDTAALAAFYEAIGAAEGIEIASMLDRIDGLFERDRAPEDVQAYRERVGKWKKLSDEIVPIREFLAKTGQVEGRIRFPLDSEPYDAWLTRADADEPVGIETTVSLARGQVFLAKKMRTEKVVPAFLGVPDRSKPTAFAKAIARVRTVHSRVGLRRQAEDGIRDCLRNKNEPRYKGGILLISAQLSTLPAPELDPMAEALRADAATLPFDEVWIIDERREDPTVRRLK